MAAAALPPPPTAPGLKDRVHLFRLLTLTIDEGTTIVRNIFDDNRPNIPLDVFLTQERHAINQLRTKKTLTQSQYNLLFPQNGTPTTADFDLTLTICLLRNLKTFGLNPNFPWNAIPSTRDTSLEADLRRLQIMRNELAHISVTTGINEPSFKSKWNDTENVLLRCNASLQNPDPNLQQHIDECKNKPLDLEAYERLDQSVEYLQTLIINEVKNLREDLDNLTSKIDRQYQRTRENLKDDLITLYRDQYHTLPLSPLFEEHDTPLLHFYVMPDIVFVESSIRGTENKSNVASLHDFFRKNNVMRRNVYLIADAGYGKTAFCKRLALTWCQAFERIEDESKYFEEDEIKAMSAFEFVFLLSLRDCSDVCEIDQMILKQIIPLVAHTSCIDLQLIETVLTEHKCLVIMDGLDEWEHTTSCSYGKSDIPHRKARKNCTFLTTLRPWKLSDINLMSSQIDHKLELGGLSTKSCRKLEERVIPHLSQKEEHGIENQIEAFSCTVAEKGVSDLESIPLLLMYLLCLWCDGIDLGHSKCSMFCQIIEMLLKRTLKKYSEMINARALSTSSIPQCFAELEKFKNCRENFTFLSNLGQLAFEALFSKTRENTLVFDKSFVKKHLDPVFLDLSLRSGILTRDKESKLLGEKLKTSFSHKTMQEFFAALYISTCSNQDEVLSKVLSYCNSISDILEMSQVFIFMNGINADFFSSVSEKLMKRINEDEIARTYRSETWPCYYKYEIPLKAIQDMLVSCIRESPKSSYIKLCLQDVIFDEDCQRVNYYTHLKDLAVQNKINIRSISAKIEGIRSFSKIITECELNELDNCQNLFCRGECQETELIPLLSMSVKCVTIMAGKWNGKHFDFVGEIPCLSPELSEILQKNNKLQDLYINRFNFNHDTLDKFLNYLVNRKSMKTIELFHFLCTDHNISCPGFNVDLSQHTELRRVAFENLPLSKLNINVSSLEDCSVGFFYKPEMFTSYLSSIAAASKIHTFRCDSLQGRQLQEMLATLSLLVQVKYIRIMFLNLGEHLLPDTLVNIEHIEFLHVEISSTSLLNLVKWIENLPQQVTVDVRGCYVNEFEKIQNYIQTSDKFVVDFNGTRHGFLSVFEFKTRKSNQLRT